MAPPRSARGYSWINTARAKRIHLEEAIGLVTLTTTLAYFDGCIAFQYPYGCVKAQAASNFITNARLLAMRSLLFTSFSHDPLPHLATCFPLLTPLPPFPYFSPFSSPHPLSGMKFCNGWHAHTRTYAGKHASTNAHVMVQCYSICTCP